MKRYFVLSLFFFFPLVLYAQEKANVGSDENIAVEDEKNLAPMVPNQNQPYFNLEKELEFGKQVLKNNGFLKVFQIYQTVRNENLSACDSPECKNIVPALLAIRYMGEGRCKDIKDPSLQQLCNAVNSNNCSSLSAGTKTFCQSFLSEDAQALAGAAGSLEIAKSLGFPVRAQEAALMLGIYNGFKHYSVMACEKYINQQKLPLSKRFACKVIFSSNPDKDIDDLITDLSRLFVSRKDSQPKLCDSVVDSSVRDACNNSSVKELRDIW